MPRLAAAVWLLMAAGLAAVSPARAQGLVPQPPGPYVVDVHAVTMGLPQEASFYPVLPEATLVPARGFGFNVGAHVYPLTLGPVRVGLGASVLQVRGTASTIATITQTFPDVSTTARIVAPQVSFNFGTRAGWSYLSGGYSAAQVTVRASGTPEVTQESGTISGLNVGGGARWFLSDHLAVGFDVRFHRLEEMRLFAVSAGFSLR